MSPNNPRHWPKHHFFWNFPGSEKGTSVFPKIVKTAWTLDSHTCAQTDLVPRSIALDKAPVCRARWKLRSREWRWRKTFCAKRRMELWATLANTAFRSSLNPAAVALAMPSETTRVSNTQSQWHWVLKRPAGRWYSHWMLLPVCFLFLALKFS